MRNRIISILLVLVTAISLAGCSASPANENTETEGTSSVQENVIKVQDNDYNGSVGRIYGIEESAKALIDSYIEKMKAVQEANPDSYWNSDDYVFFSFAGFDKSLLDHCGWLNERQSFEEAKNLVADTYRNSEGVFDPSMTSYDLVRNSMHNYTETYNKEDTYPILGRDVARNRTEIIYDANHDWSSAYGKFANYHDGDFILNKMFEYARLEKEGTDSRFAIQTETERGYIVFDSNGNIKTFIYSSLDGENRDKVYPRYTETKELVETYGSWSWVTSYAEEAYPSTVTSIYNLDDSLFKKLDSIDGKWVTEDANIRNVIIYEDGNLTIRQYNYLSEKMEESVIDKDGQVTKTTYVITGSAGYSREKGTLYVTVTKKGDK